MENKKEKIRMLSNEEVSVFCSSVAMTLAAGMPLYAGLGAMADSVKGTAYEAAYRRVSQNVETNGSLHEAVRDSGCFPAYMVEMTAVGERTGKLEDVLNGLSVYYERENRTHKAIVSAVTYPMILGIMVLGIIVIMIAAVLPVFTRVLNGMGITMSSTGTMMMQIGRTAGWVVIVIVGIAVLMGLALIGMKVCGKGKLAVSILEKLLPAAGRVKEDMMRTRVFSVLSMMIGSGFTTDDAIGALDGVIEDDTMRRKLADLRKDMADGMSFSDALEKACITDEMHVRMIAIASQAGREDEVMKKLAAEYEEQTENTISCLLSVIEPTLIALLCLVIGGILFSVMLPMAGIISSIL